MNYLKIQVAFVLSLDFYLPSQFCWKNIDNSNTFFIQVLELLVQ